MIVSMNFNFLNINLGGIGNGGEERQSRNSTETSPLWLVKLPVVDGTDMYLGDSIPAGVYARMGGRRVVRDRQDGVYRQPNQERRVTVLGVKVL